jgi:hypothetical protein
MTRQNWTQRVQPPGPQELREVRSAAHDLAQQARHLPAASPAIESVAKIAFVGTAIVSMGLGLAHLWKALTPRPRPEHTPESADHEHRHRLALRKADNNRHR